jgi:hypothetical protein
MDASLNKAQHNKSLYVDNICSGRNVYVIQEPS